jgi:hypothetical protein
MKYIITVVKKFLPKDVPMPVGRWRVEKSNAQMNYNIDLSNEDHCGPCGQYKLPRPELQNKQPEDVRVEKTHFSHILPFFGI